MKKLHLALLSMLIGGVLSAQPNLYTGQIAEQGEPGYGPELIVYNTATSPTFDPTPSTLNLIYGLNSNWSFTLLKQETDNLNFKTYKYQQYYRSIPIEWSQCIVHTTSALKYESINGKILISREPGFIIPALTNEDAITKALNYVNATSYMWQDPNQQEWLRNHTGNPSATYYPDPVLCFLKSETGDNPEDFEYRLCFRIDVYASNPVSRAYIYVDAVTGEILSSSNRLHEGTAVTAYSGTKTITTSFASPSYQLKSSQTETYNLPANNSYSAATLFTDADDYWNNINSQLDQYATDAHWGTERTLAYYLNTHGRNSIDNAGFLIKSYLHYGNNYVNAFWDGTRMTYGDGDATHTPLVSVDIVGHEITHGLTEFTANLAYQKESGALNEAFSDMIGTAIEVSCKPSPNWTIGEEIGTPFRDMSNPNLYNHPDTYNGLHYYSTNQCVPSGDNDYCGVHTNSGVANFWFHLLSQGGTGINDIGNSYTITGIGITDAAKIAFRTLTVYLTSNSNFSNTRRYSLKAAADLFGNCSSQYISVANAWHAVGVGPKYGANSSPAGQFSNRINECTATLNWSSNSSSSFEINYRKVGTSTWNTVLTASTSHTLWSLLPSTSYQWKVRSICGAVTSGFGSINTFTTLSSCVAPSVYSVSNVTTCSVNVTWSNVSGDYLFFWRPSGLGSYTSYFAPYGSVELTGLAPNTTYDYYVAVYSGCNSCGGNVSTFTTASTSIPTNVIGKRSKCQLYVSCDYNTGASYELEYKITSSSTWLSDPYYDVTEGRVYFSISIVTSANYHYRVNRVYSGNGCTYKASSSSITINSPSASGCPAPTNVALIQAPGVKVITWDPIPAAGGYNVKFRFVSGGAWSPTYFTPNVMFGIGTGTTSNFLEVEVQSSCSCTGGGTSVWTNKVFTLACTNIINYTSGNFCSYVNLVWNACDATSSYNVRYRPYGGSTWTTSNITNHSISISYSSLTPNVVYEWQAQNVCSAGGTNPYIPIQYFVSPSTCNVPTGIASVNPGANFITIQWNSIPGSPNFPNIINTGYVVRYRMQGSSTWLGNYKTVNPYITIYGLNPQTTYEYQVQSLCNATCSTLSSWSSTYTATTTCTICRETELTINSTESSLMAEVLPNPFYSNLEISFTLNKDQVVQIFVTDLQGRIITTILNASMKKGLHEYTWNESNILSNGLYLISIKTENENWNKRIIHTSK